MWNNSSHRPAVADHYKYSWEVRAFVDTSSSSSGSGSSNIATWHPRTSYTCSFCQREFRSAQALGGHMNVHRRDRARLPPQAELNPSSSSSSSSGTAMIFYSRPVVVDSPNYDQVVVVNSPVPPSSLLDKVGMFRDCDDVVADGHFNSIPESGTDGTDLDLELRLGW